ncbi:hypothetical protein J6590_033390 [Homalodisca vitripennis]|nr:hypothetical protein J6590_033390 [Homalodisca vitripennis]
METSIVDGHHSSGSKYIDTLLCGAAKDETSIIETSIVDGHHSKFGSKYIDTLLCGAAKMKTSIVDGHSSEFISKWRTSSIELVLLPV